VKKEKFFCLVPATGYSFAIASCSVGQELPEEIEDSAS